MKKFQIENKLGLVRTSSRYYAITTALKHPLSVCSVVSILTLGTYKWIPNLASCRNKKTLSPTCSWNACHPSNYDSYKKEKETKK